MDRSPTEGTRQPLRSGRAGRPAERRWSHHRETLEASRARHRFLVAEATGGMVLLVGAVVGLVWANSPLGDSYRTLWGTRFTVTLGQHSLGMDLRHWVNEGLMAFFFLAAGLEIKREFTEGELRDRHRAALPIVGALGGMLLPALLYTAVNLGGSGEKGWGIPMATDIAFAVGVAAIVARNLPASVRLFLLSLAIVDDLGAIVVIALFYSGEISLAWLVAVGGIIAAVYAVRKAGVRYPPVFVALGVALWLALHNSGFHATLAGVAMGLLAPVRPAMDPDQVHDYEEELLDVSTPATAQETVMLARSSVSVAERLVYTIHPWSSFLIVPVFAMANTGVELSADLFGDAVGSGVTLGVLVGLVVGKPLGILAFSWLACRVRVAALPTGAGWPQLVGVATLAGIGFTVSLFVADLAFADRGLVDQATVGILAASLLASGLGALVLHRSTRSDAPEARS